jgi:hypothetical protein
MLGNDSEIQRESMAAPGRLATLAGTAPVVFPASSDSGWLTVRRSTRPV